MRTRACVSSLTDPLPLRTRETVPTPTPARRATSRIVGVRWRWDSGVGTGPIAARSVPADPALRLTPALTGERIRGTGSTGRGTGTGRVNPHVLGGGGERCFPVARRQGVGRGIPLPLVGATLCGPSHRTLRLSPAA